MSGDSLDNFQVIVNELEKFGGLQKTTGDSRFVVCPFHDDVNPSLGIYLGTDGKIPLGFFHCFGCGEKGTWNEFAQRNGLEEIKEWKKNRNIPQALISAQLEEELLGDTGLTLKAVLKKMECEEAQRWMTNVEWRGYSGKLIRAVGGYVIVDKYNNDIGVLFPIKIAGKVRGAVKAIYEKKYEKQKAYVTMPGPWLRSYGLFPYQYTQKIIQKHDYNFVVIVEGPRDALRLLSIGIPALAILGANAMSNLKALHILSLGIDHVYVMPDNDEGGDKMWSKFKQFFPKESVETRKRFRLPRKKKNGELKIDPGNMPEDILKKVVKFLKKKHNFRPHKI